MKHGPSVAEVSSHTVGWNLFEILLVITPHDLKCRNALLEKVSCKGLYRIGDLLVVCSLLHMFCVHSPSFAGGSSILLVYRILRAKDVRRVRYTKIEKAPSFYEETRGFFEIYLVYVHLTTARASSAVNQK